MKNTDGQSLMELVGMSKLGYTHPVLVDPGLEFRSMRNIYYRNVLLLPELLPAIR